MSLKHVRFEAAASLGMGHQSRGGIKPPRTQAACTANVSDSGFSEGTPVRENHPWFSPFEPTQPALVRRLDVFDIVLEEPLVPFQHVVPVHQW